jgi:hypothetical protein
MTVSKTAGEEDGSQQQPQDVLTHLQRALEIADHVGLPPSIGARVQEAINTYLDEISDFDPDRPNNQ